MKNKKSIKLITLETCREKLEKGGVIQIERIYLSKNKWYQYRLLNPIMIKLSNKTMINLKEGFEWDLSSSPRLFWALFPPDGDFQIAALIHDYLYRTRIESRKFADKEMFKWSKISNGTRKISLRNIDNVIRYIAVRLFGWIIWIK